MAWEALKTRKNFDTKS